MSCSSLKNRFDQLKTTDHLDFDAAVNLYNDVKGSLDAHKIELIELQKKGDSQQISHLQEHIQDGETMLKELKHMTLH
jgi:hypothetical protein